MKRRPSKAGDSFRSYKRPARCLLEQPSNDVHLSGRARNFECGLCHLTEKRACCRCACTVVEPARSWGTSPPTIVWYATWPLQRERDSSLSNTTVLQKLPTLSLWNSAMRSQSMCSVTRMSSEQFPRASPWGVTVREETSPRPLPCLQKSDSLMALLGSC